MWQKFHGDGQRELRDHVAKKVKIFLKSAVKQVLPEQYTKKQKLKHKTNQQCSLVT